MARYFFILLLVASACVTPEQSGSSQSYFDIKPVLQDQLSNMISLSPQIRKIAQIGDSVETQVMVPDSAQWANELNIFFNADINKPVLRGEYQEVEIPSEPSSNLKILSYQAVNKDAGLKVESLKIFYVDSHQDIRKIEATLVEGNALFEGRTNLQLELNEDGNRDLILHKFIIEGAQKMVTVDSVLYRVEVEVLIP